MARIVTRGLVLPLLLLGFLAAPACLKRPAAPSVEEPGDDAKKPDVVFNAEPLPGHDVAELQKAIARVNAKETNVIDVRSFPKVGDQDLTLLRDLPNLRHLNLDNAAVTNEGMKEVAPLVQLQVLSLTGTQVTDAGIARLKGLALLEDLRLDKLNFSDRGMAHLTAFPKLRKLSLYRTSISDAGLTHLKKLPLLQSLSLDETAVGDKGLKELHGLTALRYLSVWHTEVSDAGVKELQRRMPLVKVNR